MFLNVKSEHWISKTFKHEFTNWNHQQLGHSDVSHSMNGSVFGHSTIGVKETVFEKEPLGKLLKYFAG